MKRVRFNFMLLCLIYTLTAALVFFDSFSVGFEFVVAMFSFPLINYVSQGPIPKALNVFLLGLCHFLVMLNFPAGATAYSIACILLSLVYQASNIRLMHEDHVAASSIRFALVVLVDLALSVTLPHYPIFQANEKLFAASAWLCSDLVEAGFMHKEQSQKANAYTLNFPAFS